MYQNDCHSTTDKAQLQEFTVLNCWVIIDVSAMSLTLAVPCIFKVEEDAFIKIK